MAERCRERAETLGAPGARTLAELLIGCEEDRTLRVLVGMLQEMERNG